MLFLKSLENLFVFVLTAASNGGLGVGTVAFFLLALGLTLATTICFG